MVEEYLEVLPLLLICGGFLAESVMVTTHGCLHYLYVVRDYMMPKIKDRTYG